MDLDELKEKLQQDANHGAAGFEEPPSPDELEGSPEAGLEESGGLYNAIDGNEPPGIETDSITNLEAIMGAGEAQTSTQEALFDPDNPPLDHLQPLRSQGFVLNENDVTPSIDDGFKAPEAKSVLIPEDNAIVVGGEFWENVPARKGVEPFSDDDINSIETNSLPLSDEKRAKNVWESLIEQNNGFYNLTRFKDGSEPKNILACPIINEISLYHPNGSKELKVGKDWTVINDAGNFRLEKISNELKRVALAREGAVGDYDFSHFQKGKPQKNELPEFPNSLEGLGDESEPGPSHDWEENRNRVLEQMNYEESQGDENLQHSDFNPISTETEKQEAPEGQKQNNDEVKGGHPEKPSIGEHLGRNIGGGIAGLVGGAWSNLRQKKTETAISSESTKKEVALTGNPEDVLKEAKGHLDSILHLNEFITDKETPDSKGDKCAYRSEDPSVRNAGERMAREVSFFEKAMSNMNKLIDSKGFELEKEKGIREGLEGLKEGVGTLQRSKVKYRDPETGNEESLSEKQKKMRAMIDAVRRMVRGFVNRLKAKSPNKPTP